MIELGCLGLSPEDQEVTVKFYGVVIGEAVLVTIAVSQTKAPYLQAFETKLLEGYGIDGDELLKLGVGDAKVDEEAKRTTELISLSTTHTGPLGNTSIQYYGKSFSGGVVLATIGRQEYKTFESYVHIKFLDGYTIVNRELVPIQPTT